MRWHVNAGGYNGKDGWSGSRGAFASSGINGQNGTFSIATPDDAGDLIYESIYDLSLLDLEITPEKEDGIIEPGARVLISSITIMNVGGMPMPTSRGVLAYIKPEAPQPPTMTGENWVVSEGLNRFVQLPLGLLTGDPVTVPCASFARSVNGTIAAAVNPAGEYLAFGVADINPVAALSSHANRHQRGEPFRVTVPLILRAQMTPFGRDFDTFVRGMPFDVRYPPDSGEKADIPGLPRCVHGGLDSIDPDQGLGLPFVGQRTDNTNIVSILCNAARITAI